ncbi:hypothetical protein HK096_006084, partial [Nowakowskiella sp. JEL0078]
MGSAVPQKYQRIQRGEYGAMRGGVGKRGREEDSVIQITKDAGDGQHLILSITLFMSDFGPPDFPNVLPFPNQQQFHFQQDFRHPPPPMWQQDPRGGPMRQGPPNPQGPPHGPQGMQGMQGGPMGMMQSQNIRPYFSDDQRAFERFEFEDERDRGGGDRGESAARELAGGWKEG